MSERDQLLLTCSAALARLAAIKSICDTDEPDKSDSFDAIYAIVMDPLMILAMTCHIDDLAPDPHVAEFLRIRIADATRAAEQRGYAAGIAECVEVARRHTYGVARVELVAALERLAGGEDKP